MSNQSGQGDQMAGAAGAQPSVKSIIARETAAVQELHGRDGLHTVHGKLRHGTLAAVAGGGYTFRLIDQKGTVVNNLTEQQARAAVWALDCAPEGGASLSGQDAAVATTASAGIAANARSRIT